MFGGHIDSWDVGVGAMDDGGGVMITRQVGDVIGLATYYSIIPSVCVLFTVCEPGSCHCFIVTECCWCVRS